MNLGINAEVKSFKEAKELLQDIEALNEKYDCELTLVIHETKNQELYRPN